MVKNLSFTCTYNLMGNKSCGINTSTFGGKSGSISYIHLEAIHYRMLTFHHLLDYLFTNIPAGYATAYMGATVETQTVENGSVQRGLGHN